MFLIPTLNSYLSNSSSYIIYVSIDYRGIVVGSIVAPLVLFLIIFLCACIYHKHKVSTTGYSATTTTRRVVTTSGQTTIPQPPVRETRSVEIETPNQPPSSHSDSNANNLDLPPPYPSNNHPPLYSEIKI